MCGLLDPRVQPNDLALFLFGLSEQLTTYYVRIPIEELLNIPNTSRIFGDVS